jgi:hypothetical protein
MTEHDNGDERERSGSIFRKAQDAFVDTVRRVVEDLRSIPSQSDHPGTASKQSQGSATQGNSNTDLETLADFRQSFVNAVEKVQRELRALGAPNATIEVQQIVTFVPQPLLGRVKILLDMPDDERAELAATWLRDIAGRNQKAFDLSNFQRWHIRTAERGGRSEALGAAELLPEFDFTEMHAEILAASRDETIRTHIERRARFLRKVTAMAVDAPTLEYEIVDSATGKTLGRGKLDHYPCTIGREQADLRLPGCAKVSATHAELLLQDAGLAVRHIANTNPTWLIAGGVPQKLVHGQATALPTQGELALGVTGTEAGGARLRFRIAGDGRSAAPARSGTVFAEESAPNVRLSEAFDTPRPEQPQQARPAAETRAALDPGVPGTAGPTRMAMQGHCIALRYRDGNEVRMPIERFPFAIGREPDPAAHHFGVRIQEQCAHVSRRHLLILAINGDAAVVQDLSKSGSYWLDGTRIGTQFDLPVQSAATQDGWICLGHPTLMEASVQMRIEYA